METTLLIKRIYQEKETIGKMVVVEQGKAMFNCVCLELPNKNNQRQISCIPEGFYPAKKEHHPKFGKVFRLSSVPNRDGVLVHKGNYAAGVKVDTKGCILPGMGLSDLNKDGNLDVFNSTVAMDKLFAILPDSFLIEITS